MKKKILSILITLFALSTCMFALSACGGDGDATPLHTHNYTTLNSSTKNHWYVCDCGDKTTAEAHKGGTATCTEKARCEVCSQEYGKLNPHDYTVLKHNETLHWHECICGAKGSMGNHSGGTPTCTELAICSTCNIEYGSLKAHASNNFWTITDTHHYKEVTCGCDLILQYGEHNADSSGFCTTCDKPIYSTEGLFYDLSNDGTYYEVVAYSGTSKKVNIASTYNGLPVKTICNEAFYNNYNISTVIIPDSVTRIGTEAFYYCKSLTSVVIGDSVTSIGSSAFYNCSSLTSVVIGDSVTSINSETFYYCKSLTSVVIGDSVTSIGYGAFKYCSSLTSVVLGDSVTNIGRYAFEDCSSLTSVVLGDSVTSISNDAFDGCTKLFTEKDFIKYVKINDNPYYLALEVTNKNFSTYTIQPSTKILGENLFKNCSRLSSIEIPDSVTSIGYGAFGGSSLTSIVIPDGVTSIGSSAFNSCSSLTSIVIGDSVTSISSFAFYRCYSLTSIEIRDSVTSIGNRAFEACSSLESIVIPDSVTFIGEFAFFGCSKLTINCEAKSKPSGWNSDWNYSKRPVVWGYKGEN